MARVPGHPRCVRRNVLRRIHAGRRGGRGRRRNRGNRSGCGPGPAGEPAALGEPHGVVVDRQPVEPRRLLPAAQPLPDHACGPGGVRTRRAGARRGRRDRRRAGGSPARPAPRPGEAGGARRGGVRPRRQRRPGRHGTHCLRPPRALHHRVDAVLRRTQRVAESLRPRRRRGAILRGRPRRLRVRTTHRDRADGAADRTQPGADSAAAGSPAPGAAVGSGGARRRRRARRQRDGAPAGRHHSRGLGAPGGVVRGAAGSSVTARSAHPAGGCRSAHPHGEPHPAVSWRARCGVTACRLRPPGRVLRPGGHRRRGARDRRRHLRARLVPPSRDAGGGCGRSRSHRDVVAGRTPSRRPGVVAGARRHGAARPGHSDARPAAGAQVDAATPRHRPSGPRDNRRRTAVVRPRRRPDRRCLDVGRLVRNAARPHQPVRAPGGARRRGSQRRRHRGAL